MARIAADKKHDQGMFLAKDMKEAKVRIFDPTSIISDPQGTLNAELRKAGFVKKEAMKPGFSRR
jgi:hypothetical protein